jgi:hypothetical protein
MKMNGHGLIVITNPDPIAHPPAQDVSGVLLREMTELHDTAVLNCYTQRVGYRQVVRRSVRWDAQ